MTSPLEESDLAQIDDALSALEAAKGQVDLAVQAGIDVGARQQEILDRVERLRRIKQTYFPGR